MLGFGPGRRTGWANPTKRRPSPPARPPLRRRVDPATSPDPRSSPWKKSHLQHFGAGCGPNATAHTPFPGVYGKGSRAEKLRGEASSSGTLGPSTPTLPPWHPNCSLLGQVGSQTLRPEAGGKGCRMLLGRESSCIPGTTVVASTGRSPWVHCIIVGSPPGQLDWIRGHDEPEWMAPAAASGIFPVPVGG